MAANPPSSTGEKCKIDEQQRRIWLGNLDPRLTEYQLLKILQKCGPIEKFDMLFHKSGPLVGQSRGYAFATFKTLDGAVVALDKLNGSNVGGKSIAVRLAKNVDYDELERPKPRIEIPALGAGKREGKITKEEAIRAIEAKLKMLERRSDEDLDFNLAGTSTGQQIPIIQRYQFNKDRKPNALMGPHRPGRTFTKSTAGPYSRTQPKRR